MLKNYSHFFLIIIFLIITPTNSEKEIIKINGNELDSQIKLATKTNYKLFLIFYVNHCIYCNHALNVLTEKIVKNFEEKDKIKFGIINLDEQKNVWNGLRFNITRIPYVILIHKNKMYYYPREFEEDSVMKFITEEKNSEDALTIPPPTTFFDELKAVNKQINENIVTFFEKYGIRPEIASKISYLIIFFGFVLVAYMEFQIISLCSNFFKKRKKIIDKKENDKNNDNKDNNNTKINDKVKNE